MQKQSGFRWFFIPLIILMFECIIYYKMFFYSGYIQWGNFIVPLKQNLFGSFKTTTWDPYSYSGIPQEIPWLTILSDYNYILFFIFGGSWSMNFAVKLYILLSTFAAAYSFYFLTGRFVRSQISRTIATLFFLLSPALLQQIGLGNFNTFFIYAIYFISVSILSKSYSVEGHKRHYLLFLSVFLLSLTVIDLQLFYLGVPLYFLFMFYFLIIEKRRFNFKGFLAFLRNLSLSLVLIVLFSMPLILTSLFGAFSLMPSSSIANPLSNFIVYSTSISDLLFMNPFHNILPSTVLLGPLASTSVLLIWDVSTFLLVLIILASGFVMRDRRILFWILVIFLAALLGSGYLSPVSYLTVFLYEHMPGYQVLNASYFWAWIIITPVYGIILGILFERIILYVRDSKVNPIRKISVKWRMKRILRFGANGFLLTISVLIILLLVFPLMGQGFYGNGNSGIHQDGVPSTYGELATSLKNMVGNSSVGVAYFTPDNYVYFGNSSNGVNQPLLTYATVRSPGIPSYGAPPVVSNNFFYWLYTEFYLNETHNAAQLFSIMGIKYFVTLNNVISASSLYVANSKNATRLMQYQNDVRLLYSNPDYSIFESTFNVDVANSAQGFTLMSGNYNSLSEAAALGVNISKIVPVFTEDLNSSNFNFFLNNTKSMVFFNSGSLLTLAIDRYTNSSDTIDPLSFTNNYYYSPYQGWMSSTGLETSNNNYILSDPYPFAITATNKSMSSNFTTGSGGDYTLFAQALLSQPDSRMQFTIDGSSTQISSNIEGFQWIRIPFPANSGRNELSIKSLDGLNGIQRIVIVKSGIIGPEIVALQQFAKSRGIPLLYLDNSSYAQIDETGIYPIMVDLTNSQNKSTGTYQQSITVPESYYGNDANSDLSNLQWQYSNGSVIPSWMQSLNNASATWWLKIANILPYGHMNIFLTFYPKNSNVLNAEATGESPLINPRYNDGASVFQQFNSSGLIGSGTGQYYSTDSGLFFYAKFYDPTGIPGNQALAGWNYDAGIDTPMFAALSNTSYVQPYYYVNQSHYLLPHVSDGQYYLYGVAMEYPEAYWYINDKVVQTANCSSFVNSSGTYVRPTGVNVSVLYSFITNLPPNNVMPTISIQNVNYSSTVSIINNDSTSQKSLEVLNNPNGYEVKNIRTRITIVRYGYFSGMKETVKGFQIYPIMGDLSFVLVSDGNASTANFVSIDYNLLLYGVIVYALTIVVPTVYFVMVFRRERKSGGKKMIDIPHKDKLKFYRLRK